MDYTANSNVTPEQAAALKEFVELKTEAEAFLSESIHYIDSSLKLRSRDERKKAMSRVVSIIDQTGLHFSIGFMRLERSLPFGEARTEATACRLLFDHFEKLATVALTRLTEPRSFFGGGIDVGRGLRRVPQLALAARVLRIFVG